MIIRGIIRGTTPTVTFGLPFEANMIATGFVTVQQMGVTVIEKPLESCECDGRTIAAKFTQEDTLKLEADCNAEIRIVVKTLGGERLESNPIYEKVYDTSKDGVI